MPDNNATITALREALEISPDNVPLRCHLGETLLTDNDIKGRRRTIDLSGDGSDNDGLGAPQVRDLIVANNITINALAIVSGDLKLESYYRDSVIGGPNAFVEVAKSYASFPPPCRVSCCAKFTVYPSPKTRRNAKKTACVQPPLTVV